MDNTNTNISFVGYASDKTMQNALKNQENPIKLETFYNAVNQTTTSGCCSCCKKETRVYAIYPVRLPIKAKVLSICYECLKALPKSLTVININSNGAPPALISQCESEV